MGSERERVFRNRRRREVMEALCERREMSIVCLAATVGSEDETPATVVPELYDHHLPLLVEEGLVEYDDVTGMVSLAACPGTVEESLRTS